MWFWVVVFDTGGLYFRCFGVFGGVFGFRVFLRVGDFCVFLLFFVVCFLDIFGKNCSFFCNC